tara:strand:- start:101 stop:766 length:666 start_codon:yes stop_codon:yes gene_type:complete
MTNIAIILAGGSGNRFKNTTPKQFLYLNDRRVIDYSISTFKNHQDIDDIIIVCHQQWLKKMESEYSYKIVCGGKTRQESSLIGLKACPTKTSNVLIHDAARPFISNRLISKSINLLEKYEAINISKKATDTTVIVKDHLIDSIPDRSNIFCSQTPQSFKYKTILKAHKLSSDIDSTDDIQLVKNIGVECYNLKNDLDSIKITHEYDLKVASVILLKKNEYK